MIVTGDSPVRDNATLLQAILDAPDDDGPRLVYTDWLEEHATADADRVRAAFLRLQCEADRTERDTPRAVALDRRWEELWPAADRTWQELLGDRAGLVR